MADGGVKMGIPRQQALQFAAQTVAVCNTMPVNIYAHFEMSTSRVQLEWYSKVASTR